MHPTIRRRLTFAALLIAAACSDDHTGPTEDSDGHIAVGQTALVRLDSVTPMKSLYFDGEVGLGYAVEVTPRTTWVEVVVTDSATGAELASGLSIGLSTPDAQRSTPVFTVSAPTTVRIQFYSLSWPITAVEEHEVTLRASSADPEAISPGITAGVAVSGEALANGIDIDEFTFAGSAGELVVPELHLPGAPDPTRLACLRILAPSGAVVSTTVASPGDTLPGTWGHSRGTLPVSGTYRVRVGNGWNGCSPRTALFYDGPFTFTIVPIDPGPEVATATVALGDTVTSESIGRSGDLDRFTIQGTPGALLEVIPRRPPGGSGGIQFTVGATAARLYGPTDTAWGVRTAGRIALPDSGKLTLTVTGLLDGPKGDTGAYSFIVFPIDTAPEGRASAFALGDSLDEALDPSGDIDRYTFAGTAGQRVAFDFRTDQGLFGEPVIVEVLRPDGTMFTTFEHGGGYDTTVTTSGRLQLPASGTYVVRARTYFNGQGPKRRTYHLRSTVIDAAPEHGPDSLALGDSVMTESLDGRWDVDTFRVRVTGSGLVSRLTLTLDAAAVGPGLAYATLTDSATGAVVASAASTTTTTGQTSLFGIPAGSYLLTVSDGGNRNDQVTGSYRVRLSRIELAPEIAADTLVLGDTVSTETIGYTDDIDRFYIPLTKGQSVLVSLTGTGSPGGSVGVFLGPVSGGPTVSVVSTTSGGPLGSHTSARVDVATTGAYVLEVRGDLAPYTLAIVSLPTTPESAADSFAVGDSVSGETIGAPGDLDRYTVTAAPGSLAVLRFTATLNTGSIKLIVRDPVADSTITELSNPGDTQRSNRFQFPAGGKVEMTVAEVPPGPWRYCTTDNCDDFYHATGAYAFAVIPIDPAPESVPAILVRGDTVTGEEIAPIGDLDIFTYAGTAGESFQYEVHTGPGIPNSVIYWFQLVDMTDSTVLTEFGAFADSNFLTGWVLPHSGMYELRVSGYEQYKSLGQYSLVIK